MPGKFGRNLIWRISLQFHLANFNLAVLFLQTMMSYAIVTRRIRNPNAPPSLNIRSRCRSGNMEAELCIESWTKALRNVWLPLRVHVQRRTFQSVFSSGVYSLYLPRLKPRYPLFAHTSLLHSFLDLFVWKRVDFRRICQALSGKVPVQRHLQS